MVYSTKKELRKEIVSKRKSLCLEEISNLSEKICNNLIEHLSLKKPKIILSYYASDGEPVLEKVHHWAEENGIKVSFPVIIGDGIMQSCIPDDADAWIVGKFGIPAPDENRSKIIDPNEIDVILAPCVAFDKNKLRLGRGGGFYDRYLPRCKNAEHIAIAYEFQRVEILPEIEPWDVPVEYAVTELKLY